MRNYYVNLSTGGGNLAVAEIYCNKNWFFYFLMIIKTTVPLDSIKTTFLLTVSNQPFTTLIKLQMFVDSPIRLCDHVGFIDPELEDNLSLEVSNL